MRTTAFVATAGLAALLLAGCSTTAKPSGAATEAPAPTQVSIIVPADPGGGWDQTGRSMSQALTAGRILRSAPVTNVPGAGGTVGLAQLANSSDPNTLMVTGLVMVGSVETNASKVRLEDTTPIAKLTEDALVIVVPKSSPYKTLKALVTDIAKNGQKVTVTGGSAGGADQILAGLILANAGLKGTEVAKQLNYVPNSGGGEATALVLGNKVSAAISGASEFAASIKSGDMRALAVSSAKPSKLLPDVPTVTDAGYDVVLTNWRGVVAPSSISAAQRSALVKLVTRLDGSTGWKKQLSTQGWTDAFQSGNEFDGFLKGNISSVQKTLSNIGLIN